MAKAGKSADEIVAKLNELIPRQRTYFLVATLEYLAKGGRIGGAKKLLAELLEIKPILAVREGQVEPFEQQRTHKRALARLEEMVHEQCPKTPEARLSVMQVDAEEEARGPGGQPAVLVGMRGGPHRGTAACHRHAWRAEDHGRRVLCLSTRKDA